MKHSAGLNPVALIIAILIGLELDPKALWNMRAKLLGLGGLQIVLTALAITAAMLAMGETWRLALTAGTILSLSSTAIVLQTLSEKSLMQTAGGRNVFSVLLMQDLTVVPILFLVGALSAASAKDMQGEILRTVGYGALAVAALPLISGVLADHRWQRIYAAMVEADNVRSRMLAEDALGAVPAAEYRVYRRAVEVTAGR